MPNMSAVCPSCGVPTGVIPPAQQYQQYGMPPQGQLPPGQQYGMQPYRAQPMVYDPNAKSKMAAGLLGIFLGGWGVHRFYLGHVGIGIAQIAVTICTCGVGAIWGLIEGIMVLTGNINTDAEGRPLRD
jgi:TM2 domain-containing membrane protein YozV